MKKFFTMMAIAMMATASVKAQTGYEKKHEVAISFGAGANSNWINALEDMTALTVGSTFKNKDFDGPISAEYFYRPKEWLGVGGIFAYGRCTKDLYLFDVKEGEGTNTYYTLMPAVKLDWLRTKYFGMYSKFAIGATLRRETIDATTPNYKDVSGTHWHLNWQASVLGMEAGAPSVRAFVELGFGEQGMGLLGLRVKL